MILGILLGESYSGIRAFVDLSVCVKIYQHRVKGGGLSLEEQLRGTQEEAGRL